MKTSPFESRSIPRAYFSLSLPVVFGRAAAGYYGIVSAQPVSDFVSAVPAWSLLKKAFRKDPVIAFSAAEK